MSQYASDHCYTNRGPSPPINVVSDDPDKDVSQDNSKHLDNTADIDDIPRKKTLKVKRVVTRVGFIVPKLLGLKSVHRQAPACRKILKLSVVIVE